MYVCDVHQQYVVSQSPRRITLATLSHHVIPSSQHVGSSCVVIPSPSRLHYHLSLSILTKNNNWACSTLSGVGMEKAGACLAEPLRAAPLGAGECPFSRSIRLVCAGVVRVPYVIRFFSSNNSRFYTLDSFARQQWVKVCERRPKSNPLPPCAFGPRFTLHGVETVSSIRTWDGVKRRVWICICIQTPEFSISNVTHNQYQSRDLQTVHYHSHDSIIIQLILITHSPSYMHEAYQLINSLSNITS